MLKNNHNPFIAIFDSGIGGISILREIMQQLPDENICYLADTANMPYGPKGLDEILKICSAITRFFIDNGAKVIVIACNTASAAALHPLREMFPDFPFVGMEPAVKPAAENSANGHAGVLATEGTFKGKPYKGVLERFARDTKIYEQPCPGLAAMIENGASENELINKLEEWINPLKEQGIDQLALACTHYPLIIDLIKKVAGSDINVIDPSPAIAKQTARILQGNEEKVGNNRNISYYSTGCTDSTCQQLKALLGCGFDVKQIHWQNGELFC